MTVKYSAEWWERIADITGEFVPKDRDKRPAARRESGQKETQRQERQAELAEQ